MRFGLVKGVTLQRDGEGYILQSRRPLGMVRLNSALAELIGRMNSGESVEIAPRVQMLIDGLVRRGYLTELTEQEPPEGRWPSVSVVIPVRDRADELERCLASIAGLEYPGPPVEVIVVDDGSTDDTAGVACRAGARVFPSGGSGLGPASARNRGAEHAKGEVLAFVDSDCEVCSSWLTELVPALMDEGVAAVGGAVRGIHRDDPLERYEDVMSSLSLGNRAMGGGPGVDTFYLPSCNLLVKTGPFKKMGGFREGMHVGEDVDLSWRLRDAGWRIRYLPSGAVGHDHRTSVYGFMRRRFDYGTSEAILKLLHPARGKKMRLPVWAATGWGLVFAGWLASSTLLAVAGLVIAAVWAASGVMAGEAYRFGAIEMLLARFRVVGAVGYHAVKYSHRYLGFALWPLALVWPRFALLWILATWLVSMVERHARGAGRVPSWSFYLFQTLENLGYGAGVLGGCFKKKDFNTYRMTLSTKPAVPLRVAGNR